MPGTAASGYVYPLSTDSFNLPADIQTLAEKVDLVVGGSAVYWSIASSRSNGESSNRLMSHNGTASDLVDSNWTINQDSYLYVDSSTDTGMRWGLDYIPTTSVIAVGTATNGTLSFASIPQGFQNLGITIYTSNTSTTQASLINWTNLSNSAAATTASAGTMVGIQGGSTNLTFGSFWTGAGTGAGCLEMTIFGYSRGQVPKAPSGEGVEMKPFIYRSVNETGGVQVGGGRWSFPTTTVSNRLTVTHINVAVTTGTAIVKLHGIK